MNNLEESGFESLFPEDDRNRDPCNLCKDIKREGESFCFCIMSDQMISI